MKTNTHLGASGTRRTRSAHGSVQQEPNTQRRIDAQRRIHEGDRLVDATSRPLKGIVESKNLSAEQRLALQEVFQLLKITPAETLRNAQRMARDPLFANT